MAFRSNAEIDRILSARGHVVVTGGPGSGKTTVALRKALLRVQAGLHPGQKVLFLSFSKAAVGRVNQAARTDLPGSSRRHIESHTFHSFFWQLLRGHAYLLGAKPPVRVLPPETVRVLGNSAKNKDGSEFDPELAFTKEGRITFDLFAPKALALFKRSRELRQLVADRYPLIIIDETQDTGTDQWACLARLAELTQLVCLADRNQQIYDFRPDVSPGRIGQIIKALEPLQISLGSKNNRSPSVEILQFGDDILRGTPRGHGYIGVSQIQFSPKADKRDAKIRSAVGILRGKVRSVTGKRSKSIGYLTSWGKGVSIITAALKGGESKKEIPHRVAVDKVEALLATRVLALCLEPVSDITTTLAAGLELIANAYRARGNQTSLSKANQLDRYVARTRAGRSTGSAKCPPALRRLLENLQRGVLSGDPAQDWRTLKKLFEQSMVREFQFIARQTPGLTRSNRGRRIIDALGSAWQRSQEYIGARKLIEAAITEDQILGNGDNLWGINVMTMHKSKGKEFDGVIILHLGRGLSPLSRDNSPAELRKSRRLLRVAVTRARHHVMLLTDASDRSPLLRGHRL